MNKFLTTLKSRRFWAAMVGVITVIASDVFGLDLNTNDLMALVTIILAWIGSETVRPAGVDTLQIKSKKE